MSTHTRSNPYIGPRAFQDGEILYGRDRDVIKLLNLFIAERIVLLESPSGAGKTSLIQAALLPALAQEGFRILPVIRVGLEPPPELMSSGSVNRYILSTLLSLEESLPAEHQLPLSELARMDLSTYLDRWGRDSESGDGEVLVIDQFEEILTIDPSDQEAKNTFFKQLGSILRHHSRWALFAMREEYQAGLSPYKRFIPTRLKTTFRLELLKEQAARQAVLEPASQAGTPFTEMAVTKLVNDLRRIRIQKADGSTVERLGPTVEPVQLQVVCHRLWENLTQDVDEIQEAAIQEAGDVDTALTGYYTSQVNAIARETEVRERTIREWFDRHLMTEQGIRGQVLRGAQQSQGLDNDVIERLINTHLVRAEHRHGATWYELAHDRLIQPVKQDNARWRDTHLSALQRQAALWDQQGRSRGFLMQAEALENAEKWADEQQDELTTVEEDFLTACREDRAVTERERRQSRWIRRLAFGTTILSIIALIAFLSTLYFFRKASKERAQSVSRELSMAALSNLEIDPELSILLAMQALSTSNTSEAENALHQTLQTSRIEQTFRGHTDAVLSVALHPDGKRLATAGLDKKIMIWDLDSGENLVAIESGSNVYEAVFSPDGIRVASAQGDTTAKLWDAESGQLLRTFAGHTDEVWGIAFNSEGTRLATISSDGVITVWDNDSGEILQTFSGKDWATGGVAFSPDGNHLAAARDATTLILLDLLSGEEILSIESPDSESISRLAFSPDGRYIAVGGQDQIGRIWNMQGQLVAELGGHTSTIFRVAFSPDGTRLATVGADNHAKVWDISTALNPEMTSVQELFTLSGHKDWGFGVAFSPDGTRLATASLDKTARVWNLEATREIFTLTDHDDSVRSVAFSPDGTRLVTASDDATAKIWDASSGRELMTLSGHKGRVESGVFSPDGKLLATAGDETVKIWEMTSGRVLANLTGHQDKIYDVAFSPDGSAVASASGDGMAKIWKVASGREFVSLSGHKGKVYSIAFSPDGKYIATVGEDKIAKIWEMSSGEELFTLTGHMGIIYSVAFSPDGNYVATAGGDGKTKVWDTVSGKEIQSFSGHTTRIWDVTFSPEDGNRLATVGDDGTAKIWERASGKELLSLSGHAGPILAVSFNPTGTHLATAGEDGTVRLHTLDREELMALARDRVTRVLTQQECQRYLHQETCSAD